MFHLSFFGLENCRHYGVFWSPLDQKVRRIFAFFFFKPLSPNIISEVRHWCCAIRPGSQMVFHFISEVETAIEARGFVKASQGLTHRPWESIPLWTSLCATKWISYYCLTGHSLNLFSIRTGERRKQGWGIPVMYCTSTFMKITTFADGDESYTQSLALCWCLARLFLNTACARRPLLKWVGVPWEQMFHSHSGSFGVSDYQLSSSSLFMWEL